MRNIICGDSCDGWYLVKNNNLTVIHERMPVNTIEVKHYHNRSQQFFFVLSGTATLETNGEFITLGPNEGLEVPPLIPHQMKNESQGDVEFLVISQPHSHGDRVLTD
ncbi:mannose-6-phosphate isomerase-like protein (cupin superfamily) [Scopulibacillus daqui]|uniref:Mannose-6-phosphate isomerase-like protein (Cupin superfamily) n=1 Tax=Scopulibacillus daqui TaxID=1469162 RepID=A0ABS2PY54_9BACL|nr:mannose-6-phosphate isomerase-like protein (cupin superfamily) [Scopulibacillus daqui]